MRLFYIITSAIIFLLILVISLPQIAATTTWYPPLNTTTNSAFVLIQVAALGAVMGGLLVLFWKAPKKSELDEDVEESEIKDE